MLSWQTGDDDSASTSLIFLQHDVWELDADPCLARWPQSSPDHLGIHRLILVLGCNTEHLVSSTVQSLDPIPPRLQRRRLVPGPNFVVHNDKLADFPLPASCLQRDRRPERCQFGLYDSCPSFASSPSVPTWKICASALSSRRGTSSPSTRLSHLLAAPLASLNNSLRITICAPPCLAALRPTRGVYQQCLP